MFKWVNYLVGNPEGALSLPATRCRCPAAVWRDAEARSSSPVRGSRVSGTPAAPLRIFPLTLRFKDSFISVRAAARSLRAESIHPLVCPSTSTFSPSTLRCVRICAREGQRHYFWSADLTTFFLSFFLFFFFFKHSSPRDQRFTTGWLQHSAAPGKSCCRCSHVRCVPPETALQHRRVEIQDRTCAQTGGLILYWQRRSYTVSSKMQLSLRSVWDMVSCEWKWSRLMFSCVIFQSASVISVYWRMNSNIFKVGQIFAVRPIVN